MVFRITSSQNNKNRKFVPLSINRRKSQLGAFDYTHTWQ